MSKFSVLAVFSGYISAVYAQTTCEEISVVGADAVLGFAGGVLGFPALDGCYGGGTTTTSDGVEYPAYFNFDAVDGNGPAFTTYVLEDGTVLWDLYNTKLIPSPGRLI